jgi:hypothetical protein
VTLSANPSTIDLFHNAPGGYRAQYYRSIGNGDRANAYAVRQLMPLIRRLLVGQGKRTCPWGWVEKSLQDSDAKVWIHQGRWWRHAKREDRHLAVARWVAEQSSRQRERRRKAGWAALAAHSETRIDVKGGFIMLSGVPLGGLKPNRARDVHELGFT